MRTDVLGDRSTGAQLLRVTLVCLSQKKNGELATANTTKRKRMVLHDALDHAYEIGLLQDRPALLPFTGQLALDAAMPAVARNIKELSHGVRSSPHLGRSGVGRSRIRSVQAR